VVVANLFPPHGLANLMWALARIGEKPTPELLKTMERRVAQLTDDFTAQSVGNVLWALAVWELTHVFNADALLKRLCSCGPEDLSTLDSKDLAQIHQVMNSLQLSFCFWAPLRIWQCSVPDHLVHPKSYLPTLICVVWGGCAT
jgi:hypothetical protein